MNIKIQKWFNSVVTTMLVTALILTAFVPRGIVIAADGTEGDDTIIGDDTPETINAGGGDDIVDGGGGR
jgi:hypothetical protein